MIGISCTNFCNRPFEDWVDRISSEFGHWEIFSEAEMDVTRDTDGLRDLLSPYNLSLSLHTPICDMNVAALTETLRLASLKVLEDNIRAATKLGIEVITIHPGLSSMAVSGTESMALARVKVSMRELDRYADEYGVILAIENMPNLPMFLGRTAEQLHNIVDGTDLSICYDIGHAYTMSQNEDMERLLGDRVVNVHIHDNNGQKDEHLTIGDGSIDFDRVLHSLSGYSRNLIIEARSFESGAESQSRLRTMLS